MVVYYTMQQNLMNWKGLSSTCGIPISCHVPYDNIRKKYYEMYILHSVRIIIYLPTENLLLILDIINYYLLYYDNNKTFDIMLLFLLQ